MRNLLYAATALGGIAFAAPGNAAVVLDASVNGGAFTNVCTGPQGGACSPGISDTIGGVTFTVLGASSNSPGTPFIADATQASVRVANNSGGTVQITLRAGDTGFTAPTGAAILSNQISGTVITGSPLNLFSSTACANESNAQNICAGGFNTAPIASNITQDNSSGSNNNSLAIAALAAPFSLTEVVNMTLGNGSTITYTGSADVRPVAEPASLGILGMGLLGLAFVSSRKRNHLNGVA